MKTPLTLSALIFAIGTALCWHDHQQLAAVRETHEKLVAEAAQLGISLDPTHPSDAVRLTKRGGRENKDAVANQIIGNIIAFTKDAKGMDQPVRPGNATDEAMAKRCGEIMNSIDNLNAAGIKSLITSLKSETGPNEGLRQSLINVAFTKLSYRNPQAVLAIFTELPQVLEKNRNAPGIISSALSRWAKDDPAGALEWVKTNGGKYPDVVTDEAKCGIVVGAASNDPKLAFKLAVELGQPGKSQALSGIMYAPTTPEQQTATFIAFRDYLAGVTDEQVRKEASGKLSKLTERVISDGFGSATQWIEKTQLTPDELVNLANGLKDNIKSRETGQWIEWVGEKLPADKREDVIRNMVSSWTQSDFQATGAWLNTTPAGPLKNSAIRSFAETVSRYEPEAAAQWALTLPAGEDRDKTLKGIYENWPKNDGASKAAAEAFRTRYGVE